MSDNPVFQYDVFLSHSSKDKAVVRAVAERLRKDGLKVWFDEWVLKPGDSIRIASPGFLPSYERCCGQNWTFWIC